MKIAILTPYHSHVSADYARSLTKMVLYTSATRINYNGAVTAPEIEIFMTTGSVLPQLRNMLVRDGLEWGANYLLWVDPDHLFPDEALLRLLSLNLPVVGANSPGRTSPALPSAIGLDGDYVWTTEELARQGAVAPVHSLGLGFCLLDVNVIHAVRALRPGEETKPVFALEMLGDGAEIHAEDFFFRRIAEEGFPVHLDHALSWQIGQLHQRMLTNRDALAEQHGFAAAQAAALAGAGAAR